MRPHCRGGKLRRTKEDVFTARKREMLYWLLRHAVEIQMQRLLARPLRRSMELSPHRTPFCRELAVKESHIQKGLGVGGLLPSCRCGPDGRWRAQGVGAALRRAAWPPLLRRVLHQLAPHLRRLQRHAQRPPPDLARDGLLTWARSGGRA